MNKKHYFSRLRRYFNDSRIRLILHYLGLRLKEFLGYKKFKVLNSTICATNGIICINGVYQYKEGGLLSEAIIKDIHFSGFFLHLKVYLYKLDRTISCCHSFKPSGYAGMWRLWDKGHYDAEEWYGEET